MASKVTVCARLDYVVCQGIGVVLVFVFYKKAEMTVLKNLQDNCMGATSDIIKFSVPTETKGTSRMKKTFSEEKPLFQGYVFVYCKLTQESYDSIAEVKSVRG